MLASSGTRLHILYALRLQGSATAAELAKQLQMTLSGMRQQLTLLESEGLVKSKRQSGRPGRPLHQYTLTPNAEKFFAKSYASLSLELLEDLVEAQGKEGLKQFLSRRKEKLVRKHREAAQDCEGLDRQLQAMASVQDDAGYMASVQKEQGLLVLQEHNCPFIDVAKKYPEFCEMERKVYEKVLGRPVKLDGCRARGAHVCRFCISDTEE